jgi:hypothetical protein
MRCNPTLNSLGAIVAKAHATAVDGVDLGVGVEVPNACNESRLKHSETSTHESNNTHLEYRIRLEIDRLPRR